MSMSGKLRQLIAPAFLLAAIAPAWAITPLGGQYFVEPGASVVLSAPEVAVFDDGSSVVVWEHEFGVGDRDIYFQRFNSAGAPIGTATVASGGSSDERRPQVAARPDGGFTIAYYIQSLNTIGVKRYSNTATLASSATYTALAGTEATLLDLDLAVSTASTDKVFWSIHDPTTGNPYRIKTFNNSGVVSSPFAFSSNIRFLRARSDDSGSFALGFLVGNTDSVTVYRAFLSSSGVSSSCSFTATGPVIDIDSDGAPGQFGFDIAAWGLCETAVVYKNAAGAVNGNHIQYAGSGGALGNPIFLGNADGNGLTLDCAYGGRCTAAWIDRNDATRGDLQMREATPAGLTGSQPIVVGSARVTDRISLAADRDGDMVVAWSGGNLGAEFDRVLARRYSGSEQVDLQLTQSEVADPVTVPGQIGYKLNVRNMHAKPPAGTPAGIGWATNLQLVDTLPAGTSYVGASGSSWTCSHNSGIVQCGYSLPLQPQQLASPLSITVSAPGVTAQDTLYNDAYALADQEDPNAANSAELEETTVNCGTSQFALDAAAYTVNEGGTQTVTVTRTAGCGAASVQISTRDDSANTKDYLAVSKSLSWAAGDTASKTVSIGSRLDYLDEDNESLRVVLSNPVNATLGSPAEALLTIDDDDASPTVSWATLKQTVNEDADATVAVLRLSAVSGRDVGVGFSVGGTAASGSDFQVDSTQVTIPAGWTEIQVPIGIEEDALDEDNETVVLAINTAIGGTFNFNRLNHRLTIVDNDFPPAVTVAFTQSVGSNNESQPTRNVRVALSAAYGETVTVNYAVTGGTATGGGVDYTLPDGTLTFSPGQTTRDIVITGIVNDTLDEGSLETVLITLSSPTNATLGTITEHAFRILDDD